MKKLWFLVLVALLLCACSAENPGFDRAMALRTSLLNGTGCQFDAQITADFGDKTYSFLLACQVDEQGSVHFTVEEPKYIEGISGTVQAMAGKLVFDDTALAFPLQADGLLSPVSGPWIVIKALRSGYVRHCGKEDGLFRMTVDDSFSDDALTLHIWIDGNNGPVQAEIFENNRRIMVVQIKNFQML